MLVAYDCEVVERGRHVAVFFPGGGKWTQHVDDSKPMPKPSLRDIDRLLTASGR